MKKLIALTLVLVSVGCAAPREMLRSEYSIENANKKYTMFFANCKEESSRTGGETHPFTERAAALVNYLRSYHYDAFFVDQVSNVVVTLGQFDEVNSTEAQRMIHKIKTDAHLRTLKCYWTSRRKRVSVVGNPALAKGRKPVNLMEERNRPFRMLFIPELKKTVGVEKAKNAVKVTVIKGPPVPVSELAR